MGEMGILNMVNAPGLSVKTRVCTEGSEFQDSKLEYLRKDLGSMKPSSREMELTDHKYI